MVFVEVALVRGFASSIEELIESPVDEAGPQPDTAIFYSISNCQRGLASVSFGNFLIKQVTEMLAAEIPTLKHYATLSPIPRFLPMVERYLGARIFDPALEILRIRAP